MRQRAGIILVKNNKIALIERYRAGLHYFAIPGGGINPGETPEQAAVREAEEELGIQVKITQCVAEIKFGQQGRHFYFLVEWIGGEYGSGIGEEYTGSAPDDPDTGVYIPIWMRVEELSLHDNVYPAAAAAVVVKSLKNGWPNDPIIINEDPNHHS
jgi:8-oxo-dGTP diphosphatase